MMLPEPALVVKEVVRLADEQPDQTAECRYIEPGTSRPVLWEDSGPLTEWLTEVQEAQDDGQPWAEAVVWAGKVPA